MLLVVCVCGCRRTTTPERVVMRFVDALEQNQRKEAWSLLHKDTQAYWQQAARQAGGITGKALFLKGNVWPSRYMRRDYARPAQIKGHVAKIAYFDSLGHRIYLTLRREQGAWKLVFPQRFLGPLSNMQTETPPRSAKGATRPAP